MPHGLAENRPEPAFDGQTCPAKSAERQERSFASVGRPTFSRAERPSRILGRTRLGAGPRGRHFILLHFFLAGISLAWLPPVPDKLDLSATGAVISGLSAVGGLAAAWFAATGALASRDSASAAASTLAEMKEQRLAEARPVLSIATIRHSPWLEWRDRQDITARDPLEIELSNFGAGAALDVRVVFNLQATRTDLQRACEYWSFLLRKERTIARMVGDQLWVGAPPSPGSRQGVAGPAALHAMVILPHVAPGATVRIELPKALLRGLFLVGLDTASAACAMPGMRFAPLPTPPLTVDETLARVLSGADFPQPTPATIGVSVEHRSIYEPALLFEDAIALDLELQTSFNGHDADGWFLTADADLPADVAPPEQRSRIAVMACWALAREGAERPKDQAVAGPRIISISEGVMPRAVPSPSTDCGNAAGPEGTNDSLSM